MKIQKHQRQLLRVMRQKWPDMLLRFSHASKHYKLMATFSGVQVRVAVASTPTCSEHMVDNTLRLVRRLFYAAGIVLPESAVET